MSNIGSTALDSIIDRIRNGLDTSDGPAPPLSANYAKRKIGRNRSPIRDWNWRGATLRSAKVKVASEDSVTLGFTTAESNMIATINNRRAKQWGVSPRDQEAIFASVRAQLTQRRSIIVKTGDYYGAPGSFSGLSFSSNIA